MTNLEIERALSELRLHFHLRLAARQGLKADATWIRNRLSDMDDNALADAIGKRANRQSRFWGLLRRLGLWD